MKFIPLLVIFSLLVSGCLPIEIPAKKEIINQSPVNHSPNISKAVPPEPVNRTVIPRSQMDFTSSFRWEAVPIKYNILNEEECGTYQANKIRRAFDIIENATEGIVAFKRVQMDANIDITCSFIEDCYESRTETRKEGGVIYTTKYESICAYKRGVATITTLGDEIQTAQIEFVGLAGFAETTGEGASGFYIGSCGHENTEVHEILHTLGYNHVDDPESIMYYKEDSVGYTLHQDDECKNSKKAIDKEIVDDLMDTYIRYLDGD